MCCVLGNACVLTFTIVTLLLLAGTILPHAERLSSEDELLVYRCAANPAAIALALDRNPSTLAVSSDLLAGEQGAEIWDLVRRHGTLALAVVNKGHCDEVDLLASGCAALLDPEIPTNEIPIVLAKVMAGEICASPMLLSRTIRRLLQEPSPPKLSKREQQVFELFSYGLTSQDIAERLFISRETVKWHMRSIYGKLGKSAVEGVREQFGLPHRENAEKHE